LVASACQGGFGLVQEVPCGCFLGSDAARTLDERCDLVVELFLFMLFRYK
jgi:hypothetical protein